MRVDAPALERFVAALFAAEAVAPALDVARSLVASDLSGYPTHGVSLTPLYLARVREGAVARRSDVRVVSGASGVFHVDGGGGFAQPAARRACDVVAEAARRAGVAAVTLSHVYHLGRVGEWVEALASRGLVGLAFVSGGLRGGHVAPYGGAERLFGTNPFAAAIPHEPFPLVIDFATSAVTLAEVRRAAETGDPLEPAALVDRHGHPTAEAAAYAAGGALRAFAGHRGSALGFLLEILGGVLSGAGATSAGEFVPINGALFVALDPGAFVGRDEFAEQTAAFVERVRRSRPAAGVAVVRVPGEGLATRRADAAAHGIALDIDARRRLELEAARTSVPVPWRVERGEP